MGKIKPSYKIKSKKMKYGTIFFPINFNNPNKSQQSVEKKQEKFPSLLDEFNNFLEMNAVFHDAYFRGHEVSKSGKDLNKAIEYFKTALKVLDHTENLNPIIIKSLRNEINNNIETAKTKLSAQTNSLNI